MNHAGCPHRLGPPRSRVAPADRSRESDGDFVPSAPRVYGGWRGEAVYAEPLASYRAGVCPGRRLTTSDGTCRREGRRGFTPRPPGVEPTAKPEAPPPPAFGYDRAHGRAGIFLFDRRGEARGPGVPRKTHAWLPHASEATL